MIEEGRQVQYKFKNKEGKQNFIKANIAATMFGFHRNFTSYMTLAGQLGVGDEMDMKRFEDINPLLYLTGLGKNFRTIRPVMEEADHARKRIKLLEEIEQRPGGLR